MVATTDTLPGYEIIKSLGVVEGITTSPLIGAFFERNLLVNIMREAYLDMLTTATAHGANAIVGLRYSVMLQEHLVLVYGTAVKVKRL